MDYLQVLFFALILGAVFTAGTIYGARQRTVVTKEPQPSPPVQLWKEPEPQRTAVTHVVRFADLTKVAAYAVFDRGAGWKTYGYTEDPDVARGYADSILHQVRVVAAYRTPDGKVLSLKEVELLPRLSIKESV